jgi:hypothetical protein
MRCFSKGLIALAVVYAGPASGDELTPKELAAARKIYVAKCAKCHRFYEPKEYSEADWRTWMEKMGRKSKLKPAQSEMLNRYVDEYRAGRIPKIP